MAGKHNEGRFEAILEPDLPIIDAHHHLFIRPGLHYMLDEYMADARAGHDIWASVYVETRFLSRTAGPEVLRPLGEMEFANGMAAMAQSGLFGPCKVAAAIVGHADLSLGEAVGELLDRAMQAAPDRFRGIRQITMAHDDATVMRNLANPPPSDLMLRPGFAAGLSELGRRGLSFDATILHHQLDDLAAIAAAQQDTTFVLCHMGLALGMGRDAEGKKTVFEEWRQGLRRFASLPNTLCKVGGLGTSYWGFGFDERPDAVGYLELSEAWRPYVESAIEIFGPQRCMMESNFPPDGRSCGFVPLWNALKHIASQYTREERESLFNDVARQAYRIAPREA